MNSTAWIQSKLKDTVEQVRFPATIDPELLIDSIDLKHTIEICYRRSLITWRQYMILGTWLCWGDIVNKEELAAALIAIATISEYTDDRLIKQIEGRGKSKNELETTLQQLSDDFTSILDYKVTEEM